MNTIQCNYNSLLVLHAGQLGALVKNTLPDLRGTNPTVIEQTCFVTVKYYNNK